jgi:hypothetical protein
MNSLFKMIMIGFLLGFAAFIICSFLRTPDAEGAISPDRPTQYENVKHMQCTFPSGERGLIVVPGKGFSEWQLKEDVTIPVLEIINLGVVFADASFSIVCYRFSISDVKPVMMFGPEGKLSFDDVKEGFPAGAAISCE